MKEKSWKVNGESLPSPLWALFCNVYIHREIYRFPFNRWTMSFYCIPGTIHIFYNSINNNRETIETHGKGSFFQNTDRQTSRPDAQKKKGKYLIMRLKDIFISGMYFFLETFSILMILAHCKGMPILTQSCDIFFIVNSLRVMNAVEGPNLIGFHSKRHPMILVLIDDDT